MTNTARAAQPELGTVLGDRVVVADGAMGTMLQASDATLDDFDGHEGCNEILNATRPDIVRAVHEGYLDAGVDRVTTNTFGQTSATARPRRQGVGWGAGNRARGAARCHRARC